MIPATRPPVADRPPEARGRARDQVRLLVSTDADDRHAEFRDLPDLLAPGDLLVVNDSATLAAALPAEAALGPFRLHLSTRYAPCLWLAEPRWSVERPGPLPLAAGEGIHVGRRERIRARIVAPHPQLPRLTFVATERPLDPTLAADGEPIRYRYLARPQPLDAYQTVFARTPGSAEMPSAARPFSAATVTALRAAGIELASLTLHTGVSSLEAGDAPVLYAEPFRVERATADAIARTRARGGRVIAVGTTVVRALETAFRDGAVRPSRGFTRRFVRPGQVHGAADGMITGFHEAASTHQALLAAVVGPEVVHRAYRTALATGYLWHEFGDSHLLLRRHGSSLA